MYYNGGRDGIEHGDAQLTVLHLGAGGGYGRRWSASNVNSCIVLCDDWNLVCVCCCARVINTD